MSLLKRLRKLRDPCSSGVVTLSQGEFGLLLAVVDAAYIAKHEGRFEPLHDALHALEAESSA